MREQLAMPAELTSIPRVKAVLNENHRNGRAQLGRTRREDTEGTLNEGQIVTRAQAGDAAGFEWLYQRYKRKVYGLCLQMVHNRWRAEELTQDTFLQVYRRLTTFRGQSAFSTWLHRIAVNIVLMSFRREQVRVVEISYDQSAPEDKSAMERFIAAPDQRLFASNDRLHLERAMQCLPPGYALIFVLHDIFGYHHSEIAEILCCSQGNSKSQLHKARLKLKKRLLLSEEERRSTRYKTRHQRAYPMVFAKRPKAVKVITVSTEVAP